MKILDWTLEPFAAWLLTLESHTTDKSLCRLISLHRLWLRHPKYNMKKQARWVAVMCDTADFHSDPISSKTQTGIAHAVAVFRTEQASRMMALLLTLDHQQGASELSLWKVHILMHLGSCSLDYRWKQNEFPPTGGKIKPLSNVVSLYCDENNTHLPQICAG